MAKAKTTRRRRYFTRKVSRHRKSFTLPVAVVAGFMPAINGVWNRRSSLNDISNYLFQSFTGITPGATGTSAFQFSNLMGGLIPVIAGFVAHGVASKLGVNRAIARTGIPFIRI